MSQALPSSRSSSANGGISLHTLEYKYKNVIIGKVFLIPEYAVSLQSCRLILDGDRGLHRWVLEKLVLAEIRVANDQSFYRQKVLGFHVYVKLLSNHHGFIINFTFPPFCLSADANLRQASVKVCLCMKRTAWNFKALPRKFLFFVYLFCFCFVVLQQIKFEYSLDNRRKKNSSNFSMMHYLFIYPVFSLEATQRQKQCWY